MKKKLFYILLILSLALSVYSSVALAEGEEYIDNVVKDSHKIKNKWDLSGSFVAHQGYNWAGMAEGATWTYKVHIKEAMNGDVSKGTVHFYTLHNGNEIDVVGQVKSTKQNYPYYLGWDFGAVGTSEYNGQTYYFMFLYSERGTWFALSTSHYDLCWDNGTVFARGVCSSRPRSYELHSKVPDETFLIDYKEIH